MHHLSKLWMRMAFLSLSLRAVASETPNIFPRADNDDKPGPLSRLDKGERIAVGVGITIGVILIVIASIWCCCWPCHPTRQRNPNRFHRHEGVIHEADPNPEQTVRSGLQGHDRDVGMAELGVMFDESAVVQDGRREAPPPYESEARVKDSELPK